MGRVMRYGVMAFRGGLVLWRYGVMAFEEELSVWRYGVMAIYGITNNRLFYPVKSKNFLKRVADPPAPPMRVFILERGAG